jgi:MoaA/NifB/PqqE/SkfB family radical SAM enzyme
MNTSNPAPFQGLPGKLWIYTNYDCNLRCSYCVAESSPSAARREISLQAVCRRVDEAVQLGFSSVLFTGGEPLLLPSIFAMLEYASARLPTVLLSNAVLAKGRRLQQLSRLASEHLTIQVSLDGGRAEHHDAYRGPGTWRRTVDGILALQQHGLRLRLSTTETPANSTHLDELCAFHASLGIPEEDHFIRPLARGGFSEQGYDVSLHTLSPEITANLDGIYWHPLATGSEARIAPHGVPLAEALRLVHSQLEAQARGENGPLKTFT